MVTFRCGIPLVVAWCIGIARSFFGLGPKHALLDGGVWIGGMALGIAAWFVPRCARCGAPPVWNAVRKGPFGRNVVAELALLQACPRCGDQEVRLEADGSSGSGP